MDTPPETRRQIETETLHGEVISDPYRWLEGDDDAVMEWEQRQNAYTDTVVQTETRESLRPVFERLGERATYFLPKLREGRYFQRIEAPSADQPSLTVRDQIDSDPETLVDPESFGETTALQWFLPDLDGDRVLYGLMDAGTEQYDLRVIDSETGELLDQIDDVGRCNPEGVAWDPEGFYYVATGGPGEGNQLQKAIHYHEVGGESRLVTDEFQPEYWPRIERDRETGTVVVTVSELGVDAELYVLSDGSLEPVVTGVEAMFEPLVTDGRVYVLTTHEAPRGQILGIDADEFAGVDGPEAFETIVPESEDTLRDITPAGSGIAVSRIRDAQAAVSLHHADGTHRHDLSLPQFAGIPRDGIRGTVGSSDLFVQLTGFDRLQSVVRAGAGSRAGPDDWEILQQPSLPARLDPGGDLDLTCEQLWVSSTGETSVPVYVVHRSDLDPDGNAPTVLYGYGGFRVPLLPSLDPYRLPFLADGGVFALACLRGGFEFGEQWHTEGAREHKENTFADFEAAARELVDRGYTNTDRLAGWGGSNGGLTVGAALTRSPELFGAIVCTVPLLDMLRYHHFLLGQAWTGEYGSPEDPEAFEWLRSYSPYHNVTQRPYPATLFATAAGDTRVHPAHARKMTARLQHATTGEDPICYRSITETGHGVGTPTAVKIEQELDKWAFVYETLGINREDNL